MQKKNKERLKKVLRFVLPYLAVLAIGMTLGILYAFRNPVEFWVEGNCNVQVPEWLIPT
jgi:cytochrome c-type biogenesis protein CcmE